MRTFFNSLCVSLTLSLAFVCLRPTPARADDAKPLTQLGLVAGKSVDALMAFGKLTGIPLPPNVSAEGIEQQLPFIGKGGLVTDQPIGLAFVGGPDVKDPEQTMVFVLPVKPTAATLDALKAQGAKAVEDHPDTVLMGGVALRRTADYLLFSPNPAAVSAVNIGSIADAVKGGDALVKFSLDLKAVRQSMPEQYKQMRDMASNSAGAERAAVVNTMLKTFETVDRFEASLDNGEKGIRLAFTAAPFKLPVVAAANRPGMPPGILERIDLGVSIADVFPAAKDLFAAMSKSSQDDPTGNKGQPYTDEQKKQIASIVSRFTVILTEPATMSLGVEMIAGEPVIYIVQHWSKPMDIAREIQQAVATGNAIQKDPDPKNTVTLQTYTSNGVHVLRAVIIDGGKPSGYLDLVQKGDDVYMTFCPNAYLYVTHLVAAKPEGPFASVYSASLDLGKLGVALTDGPNAPLSGMPADTRKQVVDLLAGQKISLATVADQDAATVEITVDKALVQSAPKLAAAFGLNEMADRAKDMAVLNNARQLLMGCFVYAADHKGAWPDTLDLIADSVGGKDALAKLMTDPRGGTFVYRKPADATKDADKTITLYETFPADAPPAKSAVGYGDGHVTMMDVAQLKAELGAAAPK